MTKKQTSVRLDNEVHKQLMLYCIENDTTIQQLLESYILTLLNKDKK